jgi:HPt (histidine-containing phosphotransfer) domain-containing protein
MQLIQIGDPVVPTVQLMIQQMAARQHSEIEQLKQAALANDDARLEHTVKVARRPRCKRAA